MGNINSAYKIQKFDIYFSKVIMAPTSENVGL